MKTCLIYAIIIVHCLFFYFSVHGQKRLISCLANGGFTQNNCGDQATEGCKSISTKNDDKTITNCVTNWYASHGTPQILSNLGNSPDPYLFMWSSSGSSPGPAYGEGVFAGFSFTKGQAYRLQMSASVSGGSGGFYVFAASGIPPYGKQSGDGCGTSSPTISSKQKIGFFTPALNSGWVVIDWSFIANSNYTQLWIYPAAATDTQYNLALDWADICPSDCATFGDPLHINQGILESYISAKAIYAGSSAGAGSSGTVTINNTANTLLAANPNSAGIVLQPQFSATPTSGSFTASIIPDCQTSPGLRYTNLDGQNIFDKMGKAVYNDSLTMARSNRNISANSTTSVYPNPSNGNITINDPLLELSNAVITVTNTSGKEVFSKTYQSNTTTLHLNLGNLQNGVYFLKIKAKDKIVTKKIIISK